MTQVKATEAFFQKVLNEEGISYQPLFDSYHRLFLLIEHTRITVKHHFGGKNIDLDGRHFLIPSLISSIYCLASIYIEQAYSDVIMDSKSKSYNTWFEFNSEKLIKTEDYEILFKVYLINQFRHLVIVHTNNRKISGHTASSDGEYELWFGMKHILFENQIRNRLFTIQTLVEDYSKLQENSRHSVRVLQIIKKMLEKSIPMSNGVEDLNEFIPFIKGTNLEKSRRLLDELIQDLGCNSFSLRKIEYTMDNFLQALHRSRFTHKYNQI